MYSIRQRLEAHLRFRASAYLVLALALVPALGISWRVAQNIHNRHEARFSEMAEKARTEIHDHLKGLMVDLRAFSSLLELNPVVTSNEWSRFTETLGYDRRHPGVRSIGYAEKVTQEQLAHFTAVMQSRVGPEFQTHPPSEKQFLFPTVHVRLFPTNIERRLGWDSYSEPARKAALDAVLRTGEPSATKRLTYWNGNKPEAEGFTLFVPVFTNGQVRGVIFGSFVPQYLFNALSNRQFDASIAVELFDGPELEAKATLAATGVAGLGAQPQFSKTMPLRLFDHTFMIRARTLPAFEAASERHMSGVVLACGLGFSFLLFGIAWMQGSSRSAMEKSHRRLRDSEEQLRAVNAELERKMVEAKLGEGLLARERDLLRTLLEHSPDAIYFKDLESRFIKCGRAVHGHLGLERGDDAVGKTDFDFFAEEHARPAFETEQEIIRTGRPVIGLVENEFRRDGRKSWVLTSKMPLRDDQGKIIGTFGISKDITKLKTTEFALEEEKELLAVTLRSIGDGVITTDVEGRIVLFNEVAGKLTGWSQAEAAGRPLSEVFRISGGNRADDLIQRALHETATGTPADHIMVARDGSELNISKCLAPIIDHDGKKVGAVVVFRDITEKLKTEAELLKASKLESIGVLAGGIAHDFNNILTVILGNISLARLMTEGAGQGVADALVEAEAASLRARELTQRLLTFARGGTPIKKRIDVASLVRECTARASHDCQVQPHLFVGDALWGVEADEAQISQVVMNLIAHGRASMNHDPRLEVHVLNQEVLDEPLLLLQPGRYVRISIRDYGIGIQPENLPKIFEPYFGPKSQGHGLELASAYSIVRKHEGQIRVESIAEQGTVFHIYLPAVCAAPPPMQEAEPPNFGNPLPSKKILVMDDELSIRKLSVLLLERMGCVAVAVSDGVEAIRCYHAALRSGSPFDAVIMDLTIPNGLGGKETIRQIKAIDPKVRAIVSSGYSNDPVMGNFREFGFSGVVPKPYSSADLSAALAELFNPGLQLQIDPADLG